MPLKPATKAAMRGAKSRLLDGDAMRPDSNDLLAQTLTLAYGLEPLGDGWRIMTGTVNFNLWARVAYRHEARP